MSIALTSSNKSYNAYPSISNFIVSESAEEKSLQLFQEIAPLLQKVKANPELQNLKKNWRNLCNDKDLIDESKKIYASYLKKPLNEFKPKEVCFDKFLGFVPSLIEFGLWMPGVALVASYLSAKKGLTGLSTCSSEQSLLKKIEQIAKDPKDQKCSLIFGLSSFDFYYPSLAWSDLNFSTFPSFLMNTLSTLLQTPVYWLLYFCTGFNLNDFPQHKAMLGIEKKEGKMKIALIDGTGILPYQTTLLNKIDKVCKKSNLTPEIYNSEVKREFARYGCAVFALQDSVCFLQDPNFFSNIVAKENLNSSSQIKEIETLPPAFMISTQSISKLKKYQEIDESGVFSEENNPLSYAPITGKSKTFAEYAKKYFIQNDRHKEQNHYITRKLLDYTCFVNAALTELTPDEVKTILKTSLL